jgi:ABC-type proline/glycine betaine transport system substrate-binding protein
MKELDINFHEYSYSCGEGCCTDYGTITTINGVVLEDNTSEYTVIIKQILEHLGYKVNITTTEDYEL